jgi:hypothetical protein
MKEQIRKITIDSLNGLVITPADKVMIKKFISYIEAYCCELHVTEWDILLDDDNFERIWSLYTNVCLLNK